MQTLLTTLFELLQVLQLPELHVSKSVHSLAEFEVALTALSSCRAAIEEWRDSRE